MATGDMEIGDIMFENNRKKKNVATCQPPKILPTAARPLIKNPDDFVFTDIEEPEPDPSICLNPTDDEYEDEDEDEDENMDVDEGSEDEEDLIDGDDDDDEEDEETHQEDGNIFSSALLINNIFMFLINFDQFQSLMIRS